MMDTEVIEMLKDVGYEREFDEGSLLSMLGKWDEYSQVVSWLSNQLKAVMKIDEIVNIIENDAEVSIFLLELGSLLKELGCVYSSTMGDHGKCRFDTDAKRLITLHFLITELFTARMSKVEKPKKMDIQLDESDAARLLKEILFDLGLGTPPDNVKIKDIFAKSCKRASERLKQLEAEGIELNPIFTGPISEQQWELLKILHSDFQLEYEIRRKMLLQRLDVTIDSFYWSDRLISKKEAMSTIFRKYRDRMEATPHVKLSDLLAARVDVAVIEKTSSAAVRKNTKSAVNDVIIGSVPDRGGRPTETQAPPPEMPSWQTRQAGSVGWAPRGGGGRGGGGGGGRGGRNEYGGNRGGHSNEYSGGRGGYGDEYGRGRGGGSGHYGTNEGWQRGGGRGGYQNRDRDYGRDDQQQQQGGYSNRGRGRGSRVQGGWANNP